MSAFTAWWGGVAPVTAEVPCGGGMHTVHWRDGRLILEDHDLVAEETLAALDDTGAPSCVELLWAWRAGFDAAALPVNLGYYMPLAPGVGSYEGTLQRCVQRFESLRQAAGSPVPPALAMTAGVQTAEVYRHAASVWRLQVAVLRSMTPDLRHAYGLVLSRSRPAEGAVGWSPGTASAVVAGMTLADHMPIVLVTSLARLWGLRSERGRRLLAANPPGVGGQYGRAMVPSSPEDPASLPVFNAQSDASRLSLHLVSAQEQVEVDVAFRDGKVVGDVWLPTTWARTVYARGLSRLRLAFDVVDSSPDLRTAEASVVRWEDERGEPVVRVRRAELKYVSAGNWSTRWL